MICFRILAIYPCTSVHLLVKGRDWEHAKARAAWYFKGALSYQWRGEVEGVDAAAAL